MNNLITVNAPTRNADLATVFIPENAQSEVKTARVDRDAFPFTFEGPLVPESLVVRWYAPDGTLLGETDAGIFHGHAHWMSQDRSPVLNLPENRLEDDPMFKWGLDRYGYVEIEYRTATSDERMIREDFVVKEDTPTDFNLSWCPLENPVEAANWMMHVIDSYREEGQHARLIVDGVFEGAFGYLAVHDNVTIHGTGGAELGAVETDEYGYEFQPVVLKADQNSVIRWDGERAAKSSLMAAGELEEDIYYSTRRQWNGTRPAKDAMHVAYEGVTLDGDIDTALDYLATIEGNAWKETFRNAPVYAAINASNHGGPIPFGQKIDLTEFAAIGWGSHCILGNKGNKWNGRDVLLRDAVMNHIIYGANGDYDNLTYEGRAWGHSAWTSGTITNLVVRDTSVSPLRGGSYGAFNVRGGDVFSSKTAEDAAERAVPLGTFVDGFYIDHYSDITGILGPDIHFHNLRGIIGGEVFAESGNGWQDSAYDMFSFVNADLTYSTRPETLIGGTNYVDALVDNVKLRKGNYTAERKSNRVFSFVSVRPKGGEVHDARYDFRNIDASEMPVNFIGSVRAGSPRFTRYRLKNVKVNNNGGTPFVLSSGTGDWDRHKEGTRERYVERLRIEMVDCEFRLSDYHAANLKAFYDLAYLEGCTINGDLVSEVADTVTLQSGAVVIDVQPNLALPPTHIRTTEGVTVEVLSKQDEQPWDSRFERRAVLNPILRFTVPAGTTSFEYSAAVNPVSGEAPSLPSEEEPTDCAETVANLEAVVSALEENNVALTEDVERLEADLLRVSEDLIEAGEDLATAEEEIVALSEAVDTLTTERDSLAEANAQLGDDLLEANQQIDTLQEVNASLEAQADAFAQRNAVLENTNLILQSENAELEETVETLASERNSLQLEVEALKTQIADSADDITLGKGFRELVRIANA